MKIVVKWPVTGLPVVRSHPMERAHAEDEELYFLCTCSVYTAIAFGRVEQLS